MHDGESGFIADIGQKIFVCDELLLIDTDFSKRRHGCPVIYALLVASQLRKNRSIHNPFECNSGSCSGFLIVKLIGRSKLFSNTVRIDGCTDSFFFEDITSKINIGCAHSNRLLDILYSELRI